MKFKSRNTVPAVQYPIRLLTFEVTTECDRLLNNESNKIDFNPNEFLLKTPLL